MEIYISFYYVKYKHTIAQSLPNTAYTGTKLELIFFLSYFVHIFDIRLVHENQICISTIFSKNFPSMSIRANLCTVVIDLHTVNLHCIVLTSKYKTRKEDMQCLCTRVCYVCVRACMCVCVCVCVRV